MKDFYETTCNPFIDPANVDAYFKFSMDLNQAPTTLYLDSSWGCTGVDLKPLIENGETITRLFLSPPDEPVSLQYNREDFGRTGTNDGGVDCITGDDLSRIISMQKLKDVVQNIAVADGDIYLFDKDTNLFIPYPLKSTIVQINNTITNHESRIDQLESGLAALIEHVDQLEIYFRRWLNSIEERIAPPAGAPSDARIVHGNINLYSDYTNGGSRSSGLYSHSLSTTVPNDEQFS